ncbi:hypothetical protein BDY19DRAFT_899974, partial [Irpex rosettiformis]
EEVVATLQGFMLRCNLPPITRNDQLPKNPLAVKQSVVLTDLGNKEFEAAARGVLEIHTLFASTLPDNSLVPWKPMKDGEFVCLEFSNRYFSLGRNSSSGLIELDKDVDPLGILRARCPTGEHTEDNVVLYYEQHLDPESKEKAYVTCKPVRVRVGQLVEIQVSFCVVPIAKGRYTMLSKLRSVCILGNPIQEASQRLSPLKKTKRSVGYGTWERSVETESTTSAMKRLRLEDTNMN